MGIKRARSGKRSISAAASQWVEALERRTLLSVNVLTSHNDAARDGLNAAETLLTPANVNQASFGKLFSYPVTGQIYAQPLYVSNLAVPSQGTHNVVFVVTENNDVYAFDANNNSGPTGGLIWHKNMGPAAATPNNDFGNRYGPYHDINPQVGITSTPVIDLASNTMYLDAFTHDGTGLYSHHIHALDLGTGNDKVTPMLVAATFPGNGAGSSNGTISFVADLDLQRPALSLVNGVLYVAYSSYADTDPYHGWVLGFDPATLHLLSVFNTTPNFLGPNPASTAGEGGIWQSGSGLASDGSSLFFFTGNGDFNASLGDYGDTALRLSTTGGLSVSGYFTPSNQLSLSNADEDLGSGGVMLLPDSVGSASHPHLMVGSGKQGLMYLIDRDNLGGYDPNADHVVQEVSLGHGTWDSPAYFNGQIYYQAVGDVLKAFSIINGVMSNAPVSQSSIGYGGQGATPSVSSNGTTNGIVWDTQWDSSHAVLRAYDATDVSKELYDSNQAGTRDQLGAGVKFAVPTIADGEAFVGTGNALAIFGLLAPPTSPPAAPTALTAMAAGSSQINLTWVDNSNNESGFKIERSTDGMNFTQVGLASANATSYSDTNLNAVTQYYYRVRATNVLGDSQYTSIANATTAALGAPVAVYTFDEGSGTTAADSAGGNNGTLVGNTLPQWVAGRIGPHALSFSGDGAFLSTTAQSAVQTAQDLSPVLGGTATLTAWIKTTQTGNNTLWSAPAITGVEQAGAGNDIRYGYIDASGDIGVGTGNGPGAVSTSPINDGNWHHVAFTRDAVSGVVQVFVDGMLNSSATDPAGPITSQFRLIGAQSDVAGDGVTFQGATYFNGQLDDIHIYNAVLSNNQIAALGEIPATPTLTSATPSSTTMVTLAWSNISPFATGVKVERKTGASGAYSQIALLPGSATGYTDTGLTPGTQYTYRIRASDGAGDSAYSSEVTATTPIPTVIGRFIFYNNSKFDGQNGSSNIVDNKAIATDKQALLPGQTATFANYTSYSKGIDGIIIDVSNLTNTLDANDFQFKVGNSSQPSTWTTTAPAPAYVTVYPGRAPDGSTEVHLIWDDNAIKGEWLQVTMLADMRTGLAAPDVFYFGNAPGESGNSTTDANVDVSDVLRARANAAAGVAITNPYDYNRDGNVDVADMLVARGNAVGGAGALQLITAPAAGAAPAANVLVASASVVSPAAATPGDVLMNHNDGSNDGQNLSETILTPANVNSPRFGKLASVPLDGAVLGQPLFKSGLNITAGPLAGIQDVAFVATTHDSVYAINADTGAVLWKTSLLHSFHGGTPTVTSGNNVPLEDAPVIDPNTNVLYVESEEGEGTHFIDMLSSLNLADGSAYANTVNIAESNGTTFVSGPQVTKTGGGTTVFDVHDLTSRSITLDPVNDVVYIAYADPGDGGPYNGWILGYSAAKDASNNLTAKAQWTSTPNGHQAGIWQGAGAIAVDAGGNLYFVTGNGTFDTTLTTPGYVADGRLTSLTDNANITGGLKTPVSGDYGDTVVKLTPDGDTSQQSDNPNGFGLHVADYFTPRDEQSISNSDTDLGSSSPVLLPDSVGSAAHRQLLVTNDKQGIIYLIDRNNMGGYHGDASGLGNGTNNVVQQLNGVTTGAWSTAAFYAGGSTTSGTIYYVTQLDRAKALSITNAQITATPTSTSATSYGTYSYPGSTPEVSANGATNGILWTLDKTPNRLIAYDASNLGKLLFRSDLIAANALTGSIQVFNTPTEANGHVYVGTGNALNIYGLKPVSVVGQYIFYNNSSFDGNDPTATVADENAIATDKHALLPGQTASFANYTSYNKGINGIIIDVANLAGSVNANDFIFRVGNSTWSIAPAPTIVQAFPGRGVNGSTRIHIIWPDNSIEGEWLQTTVLVDDNTGLKSPYVFYFGNAPGESGNSTTDANVDVADVLRARANAAAGVPITSPFDYNRDGNVDVADLLVARGNAVGGASALQLITPSTVTPAAAPYIPQRLPSSAAHPRRGVVFSDAVLGAAASGAN